MILKIINLSFKYTDQDFFLYSDFCFKKGMTIISAPSGKGKSTLFSLLILSITPDSGLIMWGEKDIQEYNYDEYLDTIVSIVFQGGVISYYFTLAEYIKLLILNRKESTKELADYYLDALNLRYLLDKDIIYCSGGEKYKISLFLALLKNTPLLLLDEPTAHLDEKNSIVLLSLLKNIKNKIIIIITHDKLFFQMSSDLHFYYL